MVASGFLYERLHPRLRLLAVPRGTIHAIAPRNARRSVRAAGAEGGPSSLSTLATLPRLTAGAADATRPAGTSRHEANGRSGRRVELVQDRQGARLTAIAARPSKAGRMLRYWPMLTVESAGRASISL